MSKYYWRTDNHNECYELILADSIDTDDEDSVNGKLDSVVARVYDMADFIEFTSNPEFPLPPAPTKAKGDN